MARRALQLVALLLLTSPAFALDGDIRIHDPSTVAICDGRYYVFGTGRGIPILSSPDGLTWRRSGHVFDRIPQEVNAPVPLNDGHIVWAPDITFLNNQYLLYYSVSSWGSAVAAIGLMTTPTLNPASPNYKWTDAGLIISSAEGQHFNAIDPGVVQCPDGTLWLSYGSYVGDIQLLQLDPKTGRRIAPNSPITSIANHSEASDIIFRDGYYYLMVNHGSCCKGKDSTYNIRMGRSKKVTGPYLDRDGHNLADGAGSLFLKSEGNQIGPGHFGRFFDHGIEKFSCHYEANLTRGNFPVLDIRPLLWTPDGWPAPGPRPTP
jgi:arabinan endo-1,5-alpha-L-arabinosidase